MLKDSPLEKSREQIKEYKSVMENVFYLDI